MTASRLRSDALAIWQAGVDAVRADRLVAGVVRVRGQQLDLAGQTFDLAAIGRVAVVGAGKAAAAMAVALEAALLPALGDSARLEGIVNVPANCVRPTRRIELHAARPAGVNEPTAEGVAGAEAMLALVGSLDERDLCICLLTGGASALLPLPVSDVPLADKLTVTRLLSAAGADIRQLNTVRKHLSRIKGGGLARACRAGELVTLAISDVLGDAPDVIGSGPTVDDRSTPADALGVIEALRDRLPELPPSIERALRAAGSAAHAPIAARRRYVLLANLATAVEAAAAEATRRGYDTTSEIVTDAARTADEEGPRLAGRAWEMRRGAPRCLVSGGEPVVRLAPSDRRGLGGRNQQLALAAAEALWDDGAAGMALLSGGTDGEDGPTDAAGAWVDAETLAAAHARGLDPQALLRANDAYHFFEPLGALLKTGPTDTNVGDVRVICAR